MQWWQPAENCRVSVPAEDDTDENSGAGASDDEAVRRTTAGVSVQPAANRVGLHGEDEDGDADVEDADHRDLESSSDDDELDRASPFSTSDEEEDEDDAEDGADIAAVMPGLSPFIKVSYFERIHTSASKA